MLPKKALHAHQMRHLVNWRLVMPARRHDRCSLLASCLPTAGKLRMLLMSVVDQRIQVSCQL